jgi:hypothetical protein
MKNIKSYLPIFPGFYHTHFEADEECTIEDGKTYEDYKWHHKEYKDNVSKACCDFIEEQLKEILPKCNVKILFEEVRSPREYNFTTDAINCTYQGENLVEEVTKYLNENIIDFTKYLNDNYESRSGFTSFHSTNTSIWLDEYLKSDNLSHYMGACLEFVVSHYIEEHENQAPEELMLEYCTDHDAGSHSIEGELIE